MPWDELTARDFPAFERKLDGISRKTMDSSARIR